MKIQFNTWGDQTITLEGNGSGYLKLSLQQFEGVPGSTSEASLNEEDMRALRNALDMFS